VRIWKLGRAKLGFLAGVLFTLSAGWPTIGGFRALFWTPIADGFDPRTEAALNIVSASSEFYYPILRERVGPYRILKSDSCEFKADLRTFQVDKTVWWAATDSRQAIAMLAVGLNKRAITFPTILNVTQLPKPLLGALDNCLSASIARPLCKLYAAHLTSDAMRATAKERAAKLNKVAAEVERMWCYSIGDLEGARSPSPRSLPR